MESSLPWRRKKDVASETRAQKVHFTTRELQTSVTRSDEEDGQARLLYFDSLRFKNSELVASPPSLAAERRTRP